MEAAAPFPSVDFTMRIIRHLTPAGPAYAALQPDGSARVLAGELFGPHHLTDEVITPGDLLAPVVPTNILGIGLNYRKHAEEGKKAVPARPMWFMKTSNAVQNPGGPIKLPAGSAKVDYEGELVIVLGKETRNVSVETAMSHVFGYTIANDVSARDWQFELGGGQFNHGKSFDTFCPLGPVLVTADELTTPNNLTLKTRVNGEIRQDWTTADMVFDVATLVAFLSTSRTLPASPGTSGRRPRAVLAGRPAWSPPPLASSPSPRRSRRTHTLLISSM